MTTFCFLKGPFVVGNVPSFNQFTKLPAASAAQVFSALPLNKKAALARTSKFYYGLFSQHIHAAKCLMLVAHGDQDAAAQMLTLNPKLLLEPTNVTDYSGRTFKKITAYEYAYWAKDTHMCRMLEAHMDEETKASMLERINKMERDGLTYEQRGVVVEHSKHFDFTPLITALTLYKDNYDDWSTTRDSDAMNAAWMNVGLKQRDLPVHVVNEYFHPHRSFNPKPTFNEETLPRNLTFYNYITGVTSTLFPLVVSDSAGLGVNFALIRSFTNSARAVSGEWWSAPNHTHSVCDLEAVMHLDKVRTAELSQSLKNLQPATGPEHSYS
jgi:hypothetical protein